MYVEDDQGCIVEQEDGTLILDTEIEQVLPTDRITEAEATTYHIPEGDDDANEDDAETISSTSTADYNREEVEVSLTTISEAFHAIAHKYEKLTTTVPHMTHVQVAEVVVRLPIMPVLKQKIKIEKRETENPTEKDTATNSDTRSTNSHYKRTS